MKIRHNHLLLFFITTGILSCQKPSLDDLSTRLSKSDAFTQWYLSLTDLPKRPNINIADAKKRQLQNRYKRAGFQMINDVYNRNSFPRKDSLQTNKEPYSLADHEKIRKMSQLMFQISKEFPELKTLSKSEKTIVFKKAFLLMRNAEKKNPAFTTRDSSIKN